MNIFQLNLVMDSKQDKCVVCIKLLASVKQSISCMQFLLHLRRTDEGDVVKLVEMDGQLSEPHRKATLLPCF